MWGWMGFRDGLSPLEKGEISCLIGNRTKISLLSSPATEIFQSSDRYSSPATVIFQSSDWGSPDQNRFLLLTLMVLRTVWWKYLLLWFSVFKLNCASHSVLEGWRMKEVGINWHDKTEVRGCHPLSYFIFIFWTRSIKLSRVGIEVKAACCIIALTLSWRYNNRLWVGVNGRKKSIMSDKTVALKE
jgi:hypothetical protein